MKLHVIYNKDGDIVAAARLDTAAPVRARPRADEQAGHRAVDVYVPAASQRYDLAGVCQKLRVDVKGNFPDLKLKE